MIGPASSYSGSTGPTIKIEVNVSASLDQWQWFLETAQEVEIMLNAAMKLCQGKLIVARIVFTTKYSCCYNSLISFFVFIIEIILGKK